MTKEPLSDLEFTLRDLLVLKGDAEYAAVTLWIAFCRAVGEFDFAPRLAIFSPEKRCGKSLLLEVIGNCLPQSRLTSSISASALFRTIERDEKLVVLIDEADTVFGRNSDPQKGEALRGVMNSGFKRGQTHIRCEGSNNEPKEFKVFCPVAVAGIGLDSIPETVRDRAVLIEMRRKLAHQNIREYESDEAEGIFGPINESLDAWIEVNTGAFRNSRPVMPSELNSRAKDVWKPLFKVAEVAGGEWPEKVLSAALAISDSIQEEDESSLRLKLLSDTREVFSGDKLPTRDLIERLRDIEDSPWRYMEKFNPSFLALNLKNYGIKPRHWRDARGYERIDFKDAWLRYLPPLEPVTTVTTVTTVTPLPIKFGDAGDAGDGILGTSQQFPTNYAQDNQKWVSNE